ncbi:MAG: histidine phosphatase family protein [Pseudomonadota bacterium]
MNAQFPSLLWVVRHGQSAGNVARDLAEEQGLRTIEIAERDIDVPLSVLGQRQSEALGLWFSRLAQDSRPEIILCSPYIRARQTADALNAALNVDTPVKLRTDERLREKEFGILDRLTPAGIRHKYPELDEQRKHVGKFYFRPPGGESWCDVILRLRSLLEMVSREYAGQRVLIVAHQVIVNCMRYLIETLSEEQILSIDRLSDVPNCGVTSYRLEKNEQQAGELVLELENFVAAMHEEGMPVTTAPDKPAGPKP